MTWRVRTGVKVLGALLLTAATAFVLWMRVIIDVRLIESHDRLERSNDRLNEALIDVRDACIADRRKSL